jgi:hypothetical protein
MEEVKIIIIREDLPQGIEEILVEVEEDEILA